MLHDLQTKTKQEKACAGHKSKHSINENTEGEGEKMKRNGNNQTTMTQYPREEDSPSGKGLGTAGEMISAHAATCVWNSLAQPSHPKKTAEK